MLDGEHRCWMVKQQITRETATERFTTLRSWCTAHKGAHWDVKAECRSRGERQNLGCAPFLGSPVVVGGFGVPQLGPFCLIQNQWTDPKGPNLLGVMFGRELM